jgi:hypothetical protein
MSNMFVIAGEAKQSRTPQLDCRGAARLAMTSAGD